MRLLLADDSSDTRLLLVPMLQQWGYEVVTAADGAAAWQVLQGSDAPELVLLDWTMPKMSGLEVCRKIRAGPKGHSTFIIMVTARVDTEDLVSGFQAGANEYVRKPFDLSELRVRVQAGARTVDLQNKLAVRVHELEDALARVKKLQGLLPICAWCKRIRDDRNYWQQVDAYISDHSEAEFSHCVCPDCYEKVGHPGQPGAKPTGMAHEGGQNSPNAGS
jgi:CheY-like chemotaxis protein